jgi:putative membrane-bound dehydrogenase-like protein
MKSFFKVNWIGVLALLAGLPANAAEPPITAQDLPRVPPVEAKDVAGTFGIKQGFHLQLVASEPDVASPVALSFDERGRMFVVEMIDYSERRDQIPHLGRIRLLEDTNADGIFDKSTVYADNLPWPTGVFCYDGGVFVIANPDILYLKDTKGSGHADLREVLFTGFGDGSPKINVQEMPNSLIWGLDNRIHGATSGNGGSVRALRHPEDGPLNLNGHDFAIEPRTGRIFAEAGGGQHGLSFDDYGRRFTCNNSDHIRLFMYEERYAARNPFYSPPPALASIAVDGPAAEVYRISLEEPWRVVRTRWRIAGVLPGPVEGGGRSSGYFTGATGLTIYRGNAFPSDFRGDAFVGECAFNLVHHKKLYPDGVGFKAQRPGDEQKSEFLASTDNWFRPVQFANAPDGTLYVIDMYREIIEHPWSLPDSIKKHLDLNSGSNRGRIYRVIPDGFKQPPLPRLDKARAEELVSLLEHPNGWHRDTAARLLFERQDKAAVPALGRLFETSKSALGRLHALYALSGLNALEEGHLLKGLTDPDEHVREHAIKLAENLLTDPVAAEHVWASLQSLAKDPAMTVRYQLAFTLSVAPEAIRLSALEQIIGRDVSNPWVQTAVLSSLKEGAGEMFVNLLSDADFSRAGPGYEFLGQLASVIGARNAPGEGARALAVLDQRAEPLLLFSAVQAMGQGLQRNGSSLQKLDDKGLMERIFSRAAAASLDSGLSEPTRIEAIRLTGLNSYPQAKPTLLALLGRNQPEHLQAIAAAALGHFAELDIAHELLQRFPDLGSAARSTVLSALLSRPQRIRLLLTAIESGQVSPSALSVAQIKTLRNHSNPEIRGEAVKVFGAEDARPREQVIEGLREALQLPGNADHGKTIYLERCSSCHRLAGQGFAVGPDLVTVRQSGKEKILVNILDPNREVAPNYIGFEIETKDGESTTGIIANEATSTVTLRQALGNSVVISRGDIRHMRSLGQSIMPEGLEQGLKAQDFADLLEFVTTAEPAATPRK